MNRLKKIAAAATSFAVAATMASCGAPTIGSGTSSAVVIDGYEVKSGVFIFYSLLSYYEASSIISEDMQATPTVEEVKESYIDNVEASEWIQNRATEYCAEFVAIEKEFEKIGASLSQEEIDEIEVQLPELLAGELYAENGIGEESARLVFQNDYKREYIFDYYYGFESENGMSEEELKDYFDENYARIEYIDISLLDSEGKEIDDTLKAEARDLADEYAERINKISDAQEQLYEMDDIREEYTEYVTERNNSLSSATTTVTTTTTATTSKGETTTTTTTTTNPKANESIIQKVTTTAPPALSPEEAATTTTTTTSASQKASEDLSNYVFEEVTDYGKAVVFDDEENDKLYVILRADLRERMVDDDLWGEDYITALQTDLFDEDCTEFIQEIANAYTVERNKSSYRRYEPFKLYLGAE